MRSCSSWSSRSLQNSSSPCWVGRLRSGSPASFSFRLRFCAPICMRTGWRSRPRWVVYFGLLVAGLASRLSDGACEALFSAADRTIPILAVFAVLASTIGLPFLMLGATSPLMQVWWARLHGSAIPYRLFALSNLGIAAGARLLSHAGRTASDTARSARRMVLRVRRICLGHGNAGVARAVGRVDPAESLKTRMRATALRLRWRKNCSGYCCQWARRCS